MALKMQKEPVKKMPRLPRGGDRFVWNEFPVTREAVPPVKKQDYGHILKFDKQAEV